MFKALLEIIWRKAKIGIELYNKVPIMRPEAVVAIIERLHYATARLAKAPILSMDHAHPRVLRRRFVQDLTCTVRRAVIDDHPLRRKHRLGTDGSDCGRDVRFFIADRSNDHVSRHR